MANKGIDWSSLWKKDEWLAVWIGFLIIILTLAGLNLTNVNFRWTTDGEFASFAAEQVPAVDKLIKEAGGKGEEGLAAQATVLKAALESGNRKGVGDAIKKMDGAVKTTKDEGLKKKVPSLVRPINSQVGRVFDKVFSGSNMTAAFYILVFFWILATIGAVFMKLEVGKFIAGFPIIFIILTVSHILHSHNPV